MITTLPILRFAPSPNGSLHLGHAYCALLNQKFAPKTHGTLLLRMEDIDTTHCTGEYAKLCLSDLTWLGFKAATDLHVMLQALLGLPVPQYHHHALISENGTKLSKSKDSETSHGLRQSGVTARDIHHMLNL